MTSQMSDMLLTLAAAIEARGTARINETFVLNTAQREWIATSLRHEAARLISQQEQETSLRHKAAQTRSDNSPGTAQEGH